MKKCIFAGSFDPITNGHVWIVNESLTLFDEVTILISKNTEKQSFLTLESRINLIKETFKGNEKVKVDVIENQYTVNYAKNNGIKFLTRGLRNSKDFDYEENVLRLNQTIDEEIQTIYFICPEKLNKTSSSNVRSLYGFPGFTTAIDSLVPPCVKQLLVKKYYSELFKKKRYFEDIPLHWQRLIFNQYSEPHRFYHTLEHIDELFTTTESFMHFARIKENRKGLGLYNSRIIKLAILFHDIVYEPSRNDNEEKSNELFLKFAKEIDLEESETDVVSKIILATKNHENIDGDKHIDLFLDLDLSILSANPSRFDRYEKEIRKEFSFVPEEVYIQARREIMAKLKKREYKTTWSKKNLTEAKDKNLREY